MQLSFVQSVSTTMVNASYALIVGVLAAQQWLRWAGDGEHPEVRENLQAATGTGLVAAAGATLLSLWQASATMADVPLLESGPSLWALFASTYYGRFGLALLTILIVGAVSHFGLRRRRQGVAYHAVILCLLVAFAICRVATGHAAENDLVSVAAAVELAHVLSMALWFGSVMVAAWMVLPSVGSIAPPTRITPYLASLSSWATGALAVVIATGVYNTVRVLNQPAELIGSEYGWVLTIKLCFVGTAIVLGAWNRFIEFPAAFAVATDPDAAKNKLHRIMSILRAESIALLVVVFAAAVLTANAPPASR